MKTKHILNLFLVSLLCLVLVSAGFFPNPISGTIKLDGYPEPEGLIVKQTNLRTQLSYDAVVDANGFYLIDWANLKFLDGDSVEVKIVACGSNPDCVKVVQIHEGVPVDVDFKVVPSSPSGQVIIKEVYYVCPDGSTKSKVNECVLPPPPAPIVVEIEKIVCLDGSVVNDKVLCLETKEDVQKYAIGAGVGALSAGFAGLVAYYARKKNRARAKKMLDTRIKKLKK